MIDEGADETDEDGACESASNEDEDANADCSLHELINMKP